MSEYLVVVEALHQVEAVRHKVWMEQGSSPAYKYLDRIAERFDKEATSLFQCITAKPITHYDPDIEVWLKEAGVLE